MYELTRSSLVKTVKRLISLDIIMEESVKMKLSELSRRNEKD